MFLENSSRKIPPHMFWIKTPKEEMSNCFYRLLIEYTRHIHIYVPLPHTVPRCKPILHSNPNQERELWSGMLEPYRLVLLKSLMPFSHNLPCFTRWELSFIFFLPHISKEGYLLLLVASRFWTSQYPLLLYLELRFCDFFFCDAYNLPLLHLPKFPYQCILHYPTRIQISQNLN